MANAHDLINFWKQLPEKPCADGHYIHPEDRHLLSEHLVKRPKTESDYEYLSSNGLKTALLPGPYMGDLRNAKIIVCMLNPGVGLGNLREMQDASFRKAGFDQLKQEIKDTDFKFLGLDPHYYWTGGFSWWTRKFNLLIREFESRGDSKIEALKRVANDVAAVELFAYPSKSFKSKKLVEDPYSLPSTQKVKEWVKQNAKEGRHIIFARGNNYWPPVCGNNVYVMPSNHARGGWFLNGKNVSKYADKILDDHQPT